MLGGSVCCFLPDCFAVWEIIRDSRDEKLSDTLKELYIPAVQYLPDIWWASKQASLDLLTGSPHWIVSHSPIILRYLKQPGILSCVCNHYTHKAKHQYKLKFCFENPDGLGKTSGPKRLISLPDPRGQKIQYFQLKVSFSSHILFYPQLARE